MSRLAAAFFNTLDMKLEQDSIFSVCFDPFFIYSSGIMTMEQWLIQKEMLIK